MSMRKVLLGTLIVLLGAAAVPAIGRTNVDIILDVGPPPPRVVVVPAPHPGYVWAPGYWFWDGRQYVWIEGHWLRARPGYRWVPERWEHRDRRYHFHRGHWEHGHGRGERGRGRGRGPDR